MKEIECPDYGIIEIKKDLTIGACYDCFRPISDHKNTFLSILANQTYLSKDELSKLTDPDLYVIATYYSQILEVNDLFEELVQSGKKPYEAFFISFEKSDTYISLSVSINKISQLTKAVQTPFLKLNQFTSVTQSIIENMQRAISPLQLAALQSKSVLDNYQRQAQLLGRAFERITIPQSPIFKYNTDLFKSFELLQERIKSSSKIFNSINRYNNNLSKQFESIRKLTRTTPFTDDLIRNLNGLIIQSKSIITTTNDYFSRYDIRLIEKQILKSPELVSEDITQTVHEYDEFSESEGLALQTEASGVIVSTNDLLIGIKHDFDELRSLFSKYEPLFNRFNLLSRTPSIIDILNEFAQHISTEYFSMFWSKIGDTFNSFPETTAKGILGIFLKGRFGDVAFVGSEIKRGDGFIDLFINFLGITYILELKVIGASWPISWAESGIEQLNGYMNTYNMENAYLVVFDGRKTKKGKQLQEYYDVANGRIYVINIPIFHKQ